MTIALIIASWFVAGFLGSIAIFHIVKEDRGGPEAAANFAALSILFGWASLGTVIIVVIIAGMGMFVEYLVRADHYRKIRDFIYRA